MSRVFEAIQRLDKESGAPSAEFIANARTILAETHSEAERALSAAEPEATPAELELSSPDDPVFLTEDQASRIQTLPLGITGELPLIPFEDGQARATEEYRIIRTKIVQHPKAPRSLIVSSADSGDGKTVSSINIAAALAMKSDVKVLLVDCDLRRGSVAKLLGFPEAPGLADILAESSTLEEALIQVEQLPNLYVLRSGTRMANPTELLDTPRWRALGSDLRKLFDFVVVDSPPIGSIADYDLAQAVTDGILFVVRPDHTDRARCLTVIKTIPKDRLLGVVINCVEDWFLAKRYPNYRYYGAEK